MNESNMDITDHKKFELSGSRKTELICELNVKFGKDIISLCSSDAINEEISERMEQLQHWMDGIINVEPPTNLDLILERAQLNSKEVESLKDRTEEFKNKAEKYLSTHKPMFDELNKRFAAISKLEEVEAYFKSYAKVEDLSNQLKQCKDDEQMVNLYKQLTDMCIDCDNQHLCNYIKENAQYWHNVHIDHLTKNYEDILKVMKWPFVSSENPQIPSEVLLKFSNLTKYLFLIQDPSNNVQIVNSLEDTNLVLKRSLPINILVRPIKKRFIFHFTGTRQTARIDRPEWFLTQTLTWIKDHQKFIHNHVQPVADKLKLANVFAVKEFNSALISLATERLHSVLAMYQTQGAKGEIVDVDAAFAHTVDETLGFHKEVCAITGNNTENTLAVLTKAETFLRWLHVEKKYALAKMEETLDCDQWIEPVAAGVGAAVGALLWVPRGADWFISLLKTMEDRYFLLPQPGHRLQFLELQLELIEEWRIRLTQLMNAAIEGLQLDTFLVATPNLIIGIINTAHYVRSILLQWSHSLEYLQLHYYRTQFQNFTRKQHRDLPIASHKSREVDDEDHYCDFDDDDDSDEAVYLKDVEPLANRLASDELLRQISMAEKCKTFSGSDEFLLGIQPEDKTNKNDEDQLDDGGAFGDAPELLANLRDAGLKAIVDHVVFEFKATIHAYKRIKWHALPLLEERALCVSSALCGPLAALGARRAAAAAALAPPLAEGMRAHLARHVDDLLFEEVCLAHSFNMGGTAQFTYDVMRSLIPAFASRDPPPAGVDDDYGKLPRLMEGCRILNMEYKDACTLRAHLAKNLQPTVKELKKQGITHIRVTEVLQVLKNRTDLQQQKGDSVMDLF